MPRASHLAALVLAAASTVPAAAANPRWIGTSGNWTDPENWVDGLLPTAGAVTYIAPADPTYRTITLDDSTPAIMWLYIDNADIGRTTFSQSANVLTVTTYEYVGYSGSAAYSQTGGTHNANFYMSLGYNAGSAGEYSLSGTGILNTSDFRIGSWGTGHFIHTAGTHAARSLTLGNSAGAIGTYELSDSATLGVSGGTLTVGSSGTGTFDHRGGTNTINGNLSLAAWNGGSGAYTLSGDASLNVTGHEFIGNMGQGDFTQTGGTNTITGKFGIFIAVRPDSVGKYTLSAGSASAYMLCVGGDGVSAGGTGTLTMTGGSMTVDRMLLSSAPSRIDLASGTLTATSLVITAGTFSQTGGTFNCGKITNPSSLTLAGVASLGTLDGTAATSSTALTATGVTTLSANARVTATRIRQNTLALQGTGPSDDAQLLITQSAPAPTGSDAMVSVLRTLSIDHDAGAYFATLDLTNNDLIIDYSATPASSPLAQIESMLRSGYNAGTWTGKGLTSSTAAADPGSYALVVLDNAHRPTPFTTFDGISIPTTVVIVKFSWIADLDLDGLVTSNDAIVFTNNYSDGAPATHRLGDLNYNGLFDSNDAILFANAYNETLPHLPEPATLPLLALASTLLFSRRTMQKCLNH